MEATRRSISPLFTLLAVGFVVGAMLAQNLRSHGQFFVRKQTVDWTSDGTIIRRGWPFAYFERIDETLTFHDWGSRRTVELPPIIRVARLDLHNQQARAICWNVVLTVLMLASTAIVAEYWRRHRSRPLQFGLRSLLLVIIPIVAFAIALVDDGSIDWWSLLYVPIALGFLSFPVTVGLALGSLVRRSDRRASRVRSRYRSELMEVVKHG